jgi:DNA glycosylase AlkZ-like
MLLARKRVPVARAVSRLVGLQAQYAPSPYVALWSRLAGFRKEQLTDSEAIVKASTLRGTLHVMARDDFPSVASACIESGMGRTRNLGVDIEALRAALPRRALASGEMREIAERVLGTEDEWTVTFALRALPFVRDGVVGPWPHHKPPRVRHWREPLPDPQESATRVVHAYLAAYGPATRHDIERFTAFKIRQIRPALEGLPERDGLYDVSRGMRATASVRAPVRFLPAYDSMLFAHLDTGRVIPAEYVDAVYNRKNATCKNTFTADGFVAGTWRIEREQLVVEPFAPLPPKWRREVDAEGARLLAWYLG